MQLYLIRHADAVSAEENPARPLSPRGLRQVGQLVAHFLHSGTLRPGEIWHSPLTRAEETATVLAAGLNLAIPLVEQPGLEPEDDPRNTIERLARATCDLAIVGHEPHLGALAALLVHGPQPPAPFIFKKAAVLALEARSGRWLVRWHLSPELLKSPGAD